MIAFFRALMQRLRQPKSPAAPSAVAAPAAPPTQTTEPHDGLMPYDAALYERARTQWQFGDWESLAQIEPDSITHHPQRARLALLAASAHLQLGQTDAGRHFLQLAKEWGCEPKLLAQVMIAGVHSTLGRASALGEQAHRALEHTTAALALATPGADLRLLVPARLQYETRRLGIPAPDDRYILMIARTLEHK